MAKRGLRHLDAWGGVRMVDVSGKAATAREAVAEGCITMRKETLRAIAEGRVPKGEALAVARVAGVMAGKKCGELIPLCHPLGVESVEVNFQRAGIEGKGRGILRIRASARVTGKTGVEMEALTAVAVAALTVYDMCKGMDRSMIIGDIRVVKKSK